MKLLIKRRNEDGAEEKVEERNCKTFKIDFEGCFFADGEPVGHYNDLYGLNADTDDQSELVLEFLLEE